MDIFYSPYRLTPLKRINRNSNLEPKEGVLLKAQWGQFTGFADYFPQTTIGDKGWDPFLAEFHLQKDNYSRKVFHLLQADQHYQKIPNQPFMNHQLWTGTEDLCSNIVKYKLLQADDLTFLDPLKRGLKLRLDANALFNRQSFERFISSIPAIYHPQIDYIEDPLLETDWNGLGIKTARDITNGSPYDYYVYRPNAEFFPESEPKVIFSSYLGGCFGRWHTYCEMIQKGDLKQVHGIIGIGFYQQELNFFEGNYFEGFRPKEDLVKELYQAVATREWKLLRSM